MNSTNNWTGPFTVNGRTTAGWRIDDLGAGEVGVSFLSHPFAIVPHGSEAADRVVACLSALAGCPDPERAVGAAREAISKAADFIADEYAADNDQGDLIPDPKPRKVHEALCSALALLGATKP